MEPLLGEAERESVMEYMNSGGFLTEHKQTALFEKRIADFVGVKDAIVVPNGTISLHMMLWILGIGPGDEVIVPNYTMIATANSIVSVGATPVFVDIDLETLCLIPEMALAAITNRTRAVFLVSANGRYPNWNVDEFSHILQSKGINLLEDAAQSLGSSYPDAQHIGTKGLMGSFSFSMPKIITTGQGGCVVTNDVGLSSRLRKLKNFGRSEGGIDTHETIGFNFKFTDLQAVIGIAQMNDLSRRIARKKEIWKIYDELLKNLPEISLFGHNLINTTPWFIDCLADKRDQLANFLRSLGIGTRLMYPPINKQEAYMTPGEFPNSNTVGKYGLWLPSAVQLTDSEIFQVCLRIKEFYRGS